MTHQVSFRLTDEQFKELSAKALEHGMTLSNYSKQFLLGGGEVETGKNILDLKTVDNLARAKKKGDTFSLKELFTEEVWYGYTKASRLSVGRVFRNSIRDGGHLKGIYDINHKKSSNTTIYERL